MEILEIVIAIIAIVLGIIGIIGSIIPGIPGPPISWIGMLLLYLWGGGTHAGHPMTLAVLIIWLVLTIVITVLDYIVPAYFTRITGGTKYSSIGSTIGLIVGMFISPIFMIIGTLLGAFLAELIFAKKEAGPAIKSALGAFFGFLLGTGMKLIACGIMMYDIIIYAF